MNKTKIEWCDYTWNPITGCKNGCEYCYAMAISRRFNRSFEPGFHTERLNEPHKAKKPSKIFTVSMGDMFGDWVPDTWIKRIFDVMHHNPQHIFQVLTKNPKRLSKIDKFPANAWIGVTVDTDTGYNERIRSLLACSAKLKFVSFEPLLTPINFNNSKLDGIDWVIIGGRTGNKPFVPPEKWVDEIVGMAKDRGIAVFLKNNLHYPKKIQEFPL